MSLYSRTRPGTWGAPPSEPRTPQWHKDRQRRLSEARELYAAGFERFGRHGWWRRAGSGTAPSMSRGEALKHARRELFLRAAYEQLTRGDL